MAKRFAIAKYSIGALLALTFAGCPGDEPAPSAEREHLLAEALPPGSLIIPMDTSSQDRGMLRAYGLVYRLLANDVPVRWAIAPGKSQNGEDFSATTRDLRTGAALGARSYGGGPFVISAADRAVAQPIIDAWLQDDCVTAVHEATEPFSAEPTRLLVSAPRLAVALDRYQSIAFKNFNAAGIPDSQGQPWSASSPDLLDESEIIGDSIEDTGDGALWSPDGGPAYCHLTFTYYWANKTKTADMVRELRTWLGSGNHTHLFAQAESLRAIESSPHGQFLTTGGVVDDGYAPWSVGTWTPGEPLAQFHGTFRASRDVMDSIGLLPGSQFYPATARMLGSASAPAGQSRLLLLSGPRDGQAGNGTATYLAGFDYGTDVPISSHPYTNGLRILLNSVLASECNLPENQPHLALTSSATATVADGPLTFTIHYTNDGAGHATGGELEASVPAGTTVLETSGNGQTSGNLVRWALGSLAPGETGVATFSVSASAAGTYTTQLALRYRSGVTPRQVTASQSGSTGGSNAPDTVLLAVPPSPTDSTEALLAFDSPTAAATFECSLDGAAFAGCESPLTLSDLAPGAHTFAVRAIAGGLADPTPASHAWTINRTPVARADQASIAEDSPLHLIDVLANDTLGDAPTTLTAFTAPTSGTLAQVGDKLGYTPLADFHGADSFSYTIVDADGQTSTAQVELEVLSVDDLPVATDDDASVAEDGEVLVDVLGNDTGLGDAPVSVTAVTAPAHGTAVILGNRVHYAPAADYSGQDEVSYTLSDGDGDVATARVRFTVTSQNDAPIARDDAATVAEDAATDLSVLDNDTIADAPGALIALTAPSHGTAMLIGDGLVRYTPSPDYHGSDSFTYTVADADGEQATATAVLTVTSVDDVPLAHDDNATTPEDHFVTIAVLDNDSGLGDAPVQISAITPPAHGVLSMLGQAIRYTPAPDYHGPDAFTYTVSDGDGQTATASVSVDVTSVDDAPVAADDEATVAEDSMATPIAVLANDQLGDAPTTITTITDPPHGTVVAMGELLLYTPDPDFHGADGFGYTLTDGDGQTATGNVAITVTSVDDLPVAVDDVAATLGTEAVSIDVLANDSGLGDAPITVVAVGTPSAGTATLVGDTVRYTPQRTVGGEFAFSYIISDADGDLSAAMIRVTVTPVNSSPVAADDVATVLEDGTVLVAVRNNDSGGDSPVVISAISDPPRGSALLEGEAIRYTPDANQHGTDSFTYTVSDEDGETATGTVTITITPVNDTPVGVTDSFSVQEDSSANVLDVLANDTGVGDAPLVVTLVSAPAQGTATIGADNKIRYTPRANYSGTDTLLYRVRDADGQSATATAFITVVNVNDAPVANNDTFAATAGVLTTLNVLANDSDVDGNPLTLTAVTTPSAGTATIASNRISYTAPVGFVGAATFSYTISDGRGGTASASVTVNVSAPALIGNAGQTASGSPVSRISLQ